MLIGKISAPPNIIMDIKKDIPGYNTINTLRSASLLSETYKAP